MIPVFSDQVTYNQIVTLTQPTSQTEALTERISQPEVQLSRTVRFALNDPPAVNNGDQDSPPRDNTFSMWPAMRGLGRYYELEVFCRGQADPQTGYFINIKHIDTAVRDHVFPVLDRAIQENPSTAELPMGRLMQDMLIALQPGLNNSVERLVFHLTPRYSLEIASLPLNINTSMSMTDQTATPESTRHVTLRQRYEFSAAHRLHVDSLTDDDNRATFGKCNNPAGHGHNYQIEVAVDVPIDPMGRIVQVEDIDAAVDAHCIEHLDHKHLNIDVPQFQQLNPSVENIVTVVWDMLEQPLSQLSTHPDRPTRLHSVSVWETGKTVCTYSPPPPPASQA